MWANAKQGRRNGDYKDKTSVWFQNHKDVGKVSSSFFVTNFHKDLQEKDLWTALEEYGPIADIYIARKLAKSGRKFAFVRFLNVKDEKQLEGRLANVWIGSFHLFIAISKFGREQNQNTKPRAKETESRKETGHKAHGSQNMRNVPEKGNNSYASCFKKQNMDDKGRNAERLDVVIESKETLKITDAGTILLGKVRDINLIENLPKVCVKEGYRNVDITYVGGTWVWIEFESQKSCVKFKQNPNMTCYFIKIEQLTKQFLVDDRVVWIEIEGLPLCAWSAEAFKKIASSWGDVVFVDDDDDVAVSCGRVCIKMEVGKKATGVLKVSVEGVTYEVQVREAGAWLPTINKESGEDNEEGGLEEEEESEDEDESEEDISDFDNQDDEVVKETCPVNYMGSAPSFCAENVQNKSQENENHKETELNDTTNSGIGKIDEDNRFEAEDLNQKDGVNEKNSNCENVNDAKEGEVQKSNIVLEKEGSESQERTPSRPPSFWKKYLSKSAGGGKKDRNDEGGNEARRASFSASSVLKGGKGNGYSGQRTDGGGDATGLTLIANMSRAIEIGCTMGHDMEGVKEALSGIIKGIGEKMVDQ